jgi:hypothetical protein
MCPDFKGFRTIYRIINGSRTDQLQAYPETFALIV